MKFKTIFALGLCALHSLTAAPAPHPHIPHALGQEFPLTAIKPAGWLQEFLQRQADGLGGYPHVSGYPFNTRMWLEEIRVPEKHFGELWWPYEQTAYYLDGIMRCGYLLGNEILIARAQENTAYVLNHPHADGTLGPKDADDWSRGILFRAMMAEYEVAPNPAILDALTTHYLQSPRLFNEGRALMSIEPILWLYGKTRDERLLTLAITSFHHEKGSNAGGEYVVTAKTGAASKLLNHYLSDEVPKGHGVSYIEQVKIPAILYLYTGDKKYLAASIHGLEKLQTHHLLIDGCPSSVEHLSGKAVTMAHETCDTVDLAWTAGYLLMATRDGRWADLLERDIFNAGMGSIGKDFRSHQYYSAPNQPVAATGSSQFNIDKGWGLGAVGRLCYRTGHDTECCTGNIQRLMPAYAGRMWLQDNVTGGVIAALYGPSALSLKIGPTPVEIVQATEYPFGDEIRFTINTSTAVNFPLWLRIPGWAGEFSIQVNGEKLAQPVVENGFVKIAREFKNRDTVTLNLPMTPRLVRAGATAEGVAVERGPLVYSLPVTAQITTFPFLGGKDVERFPNQSMIPNSPWQYALHAQESSIEEIKTKSTGYPWDLANVPLKLKIRARQVKNWQLDGDKHAPIWPANMELNPTSEAIELVPLGATYLRMTIFPVSP